MFARLKGLCGREHTASATIGQALVWGAVILVVAAETRGTPAAKQVTLWLTTGAFTSLMLASRPALFGPRKSCGGR